MNKTILFNDQWEFTKTGLDETEPINLDFKPVDIPHDWLIYNTLDLYENSIGWYRKKFVLNKEKGKEYLLRFDGVYMDSSVYVNNKLIGEWKYGYSAFEHDMTDALVDGENEILVKVVHQSPNSRWYSGAGIYRNVWLKVREKNHHIESDGIYVSIKKKNSHWDVKIITELTAERDAELSHTILYNGEVVAKSKAAVAAQTMVNEQTITVENPRLWSVDDPNLYELQTELRVDQELVEQVKQNIGFRTLTFDPDKGFFLNGQHMKLKGVCEHHDLGALGAAFNQYALRRRFKILKDMGVNALRTAHNMPAKEFMELADEMGFLVISEAFDMWERPKTEYDYARFFNEWVEKDVRSWVRRDRNHPSLLMWSIGNEIYDTHADERGQEITKMLVELVRKHDPLKNAPTTIGSNFMPWEGAQKCAEFVDIVGYNYGEKYYEPHHKEHPEWIIYGSETGSVLQSRGVYHFPYEQAIVADDDEQCSSLGNSFTSWGAKSPEDVIIADRDAKFSLGTFVWTGFDYIGEPTPYDTKNSYFGQVDTATFKKDSYYIYQAAWTDYKKNPMVHIFPYWDFNEGQIIDVRVATNAPKVELQLNGQTIGVKEIDHEHGYELVPTWKVPFEKGELKAIAYDEEGNIIATDIKRTFGDPRKIRLHPDKETLVANGRDLIFVEITVEDENGNLVENASNRVFVEVTGAGRLVGLDNGDSTDYDQYKGKSRRLFNGKLMAMIAAKTEAGKINIAVKSKGLEGAALEFEALPANEKELTGITAIMENSDMPIVMGQEDEVPVRKIDIISPTGTLLDADHKEKTIEIKLHPENATYQDVEFSIVSDGGIPSEIATIETDGHKAKVIALGDGKFRVRCTTKNGTDQTKLISELEFEAKGIGQAYRNPYELIYGGSYDEGEGITTGNSRGFATMGEGRSLAVFRNLDFGKDGSDTVTLPIFANTHDPCYIQIWEGVPGEEGSELIGDLVYHKEPQWLTWQPETYRLAKRLTGIKTISFVVENQKFDIQGFYFEKQSRAFVKNLAVEADIVYGDTFTKTETTLENIGNNVSLTFKDLDFTDGGATKIVISGRSPIEKNTIHIRFTDEDGESVQIVEFTRTDHYEEKIFEIDKVTGRKDVTFIFLPGSKFDFAWFEFKK